MSRTFTAKWRQTKRLRAKHSYVRSET